MSADLKVVPVEHVWSWQSDHRRERTPLGHVDYVVQRLVCSCEYATKWRRDAYLADRQARREHGCDRQLAIL